MAAICLPAVALLLLSAGRAAGQGAVATDPSGALVRSVFMSADPATDLASRDDASLPADARSQLLEWIVAVRAARAGDGSGSSAGPLVGPATDAARAQQHAAWAEGYLKAHRDSPLTPFLYTLLMVQLRQAFELQAGAADVSGQTATAKKYRAFLQRAQNASDPLIVRLAQDIDRQPFLFAETMAHPRDFNPDT
ncbi:MAG TPA: hypothetical protein VIL35_02030 [Vicinamibacterales bacterium]